MPLLSGAQKWKKQLEINGNVVKLQKINAFIANAKDKNDAYIKFVSTQKMIVIIVKTLIRRTQLGDACQGHDQSQGDVNKHGINNGNNDV